MFYIILTLYKEVRHDGWKNLKGKTKNHLVEN